MNKVAHIISVYEEALEKQGISVTGSSGVMQEALAAARSGEGKYTVKQVLDKIKRIGGHAKGTRSVRGEMMHDVTKAYLPGRSPVSQTTTRFRGGGKIHPEWKSTQHYLATAHPEKKAPSMFQKVTGRGQGMLSKWGPGTQHNYAGRVIPSRQVGPRV